MVTKYKTAIDKGMYPFPGYPFSQKSRGIGDLIYIEPYNLPSSNRIELQKWNWPLEQPFQMPKEQRAGMLTHPAWLAAYSLNEDNDPIHRGIWVYKHLLAGVLGDVPPDVDAAVPTDPHQTLRERMESLRSDRCWKCHRKMNLLVNLSRCLTIGAATERIITLTRMVRFTPDGTVISNANSKEQKAGDPRC